MSVSLTFTAIQKSSLSSATVSDTTYLSTSVNNTDVYNILTSIISQLNGNTTYFSATTKSTLIYLYTLLQSLVQSLSISSYSGTDTASVPIIKQYYDAVYAKYNTGGFTTQTTYLSAYDPTRANMLYTIWKLISNCVVELSTLSGTTPTVQFNTTYMTNAKVTNLLQSVQQIIYIHNQLLKDMATIHAYVNSDSVVIDTDITILNTDPYLNNSFPIIESGNINLTSSSTAMLIGSAILPLNAIYELTNGLTHVHVTSATLPANAANNTTTSLIQSTTIGSKQVRVSSTTNFSVGKCVAIGGTYTGTTYGGSTVIIREYNYITAIDTTNKIVTLDAPIQKPHFVNTIIQCFTSYTTTSFAPIPGCETVGYSIVVAPAPSGWNSVYVDYVPNVTIGDLYYFDNPSNTWNYYVNEILTPPDNKTLVVGSGGDSITETGSRMVMFYKLPSPQTSLYPTGANEGSALTTRTNSAIGANISTFTLRSTLGSTNAQTKLIPNVSIIIVGTGNTRQTRLVTAVATNSVTVSPALSTAVPINTFVQSYAIYSMDQGAIRVGNAPGTSLPLSSTISTITTTSSSALAGTNILNVLSTYLFTKGMYASINANTLNAYSHVITNVDASANQITVFPALTWDHSTNIPVQGYTYGDSVIPADATATYLTTQQQLGSITTTPVGTSTFSINGFMNQTPDLTNSYVAINRLTSLEYSVVSSYAPSSTLVLSQPSRFAHTNKIPFRFFTFPKSPPTGSVLESITTLSNSTVFGAITITVSSITNITVGSVVIVDPAGTFEEVTVESISGNVCTLSKNLFFPHTSGCSCVFYKINNLPIGAIYKKYGYASNPISSGQSTFIPTSLENISVGDYIQFENSTAVNSNEVVRVTSINSGTMTITVSPNFLSSHSSGVIFQVFTMNIPPVPAEATIHHINMLSANSTVSANTLRIYNNLVQTSSCVASIGTGLTRETVQISGVNSTSVYNLRQPCKYAHNKYELVVLYTMDFSFTTTNTFAYKQIYTTATSAVSVGQTVLPVFSTDNIAVGDYIMLKPSTLFYNQEYKQVTSVGTNSITVSPPFTTSRVSGIGIGLFTYRPLPSPTNLCGGIVFPVDNSGFQGSNNMNLRDASEVSVGQFIYYDIPSNTTSYVHKIVAKSGNSITVFPKFRSGYSTDLPGILFTEPSTTPSQTTLVMVDTLPIAVSAGDSFLSMTTGSIHKLRNTDDGNNNLSLFVNGVTRVIIGNENRLVLKQGTATPKYIALDAPLNNSYPVNTYVQYYNPPDTTTTYIPLGNNNGNTFIMQGNLLQTSLNNSPVVYLDTVENIFVGAGMSFKPNNNANQSTYSIISINTSNNSITLNANPSYNHYVGDAVIVYGKSPALPTPNIYAISSTYITSAVSSGSNAIVVRSLSSDVSLSNVSNSIITVGTRLCIGYISLTEMDYIVTSVDYSTNTITLDRTLVNSYISGTLCQFYSYPVIPPNSTLISITKLSANAQNVKVINVVSTAGMCVGYGISVTANTNIIEYATITAISGNTITLSNNVLNSYNTTTALIQTYVTSPPPLPLDSIPSTITHLTSASSVNSTTITVANSSTCVANTTYVMIDVGTSVETALVTDVNKLTNVLTLNKSLSLSHTNNCIVRFFSYPSIPTGSTNVLSTTTFFASSVGDTSLTLYSTSGIIAGTTFLQIGSSSNIEQNILVTGVSGNVVTLETGLLYTHSTNSYVSFYQYPVTVSGSLALPTGANRKGVASITSSVSSGATTISVSSVVGIVSGFTYLHITDAGENVETNILISSISGNTITINSPLTYAHSANTVVEYFTYAPVSSDATIIRATSLSTSYSSGDTTMTVNNSSGINAGSSYISLTTGTITEKDIQITEVNGNVLTLKNTLTNSYSLGLPIQLYSYPSIPVDTTHVSTNFSQYFSRSGATTLFLNSTTGIYPGMFLQIDSGSSFENNICIFGVSDNVLTVSKMKYDHHPQSVIIVYTYDSLPSSYKMNGVRTIVNSASSGSTTLVASNIITNDSNQTVSTNYHYVQIGTGSSKENILIQSIMYNKITLATPLTNNHLANKSLILYDLTIPQYALDPIPILKSTVKTASTTGTTNITINATPYITIPSTLNSYVDIDVNSNADLFIPVSNYDVDNTRLSLSSAAAYNHAVGSSVVLYNYPVPNGGTAVTRYTILYWGSSQAGSNTFRVWSTTNVAVGNYVKLGSGDSVEIDNVVTAIDSASSTITLKNNLLYNHPQYTTALFYNYSTLPLGSTNVGTTRLKYSSTMNTNKIVVNSTNGIISGKTCINIDSSSLNMTESYLLVTDVNTVTNTLTLAVNMTYNHLEGTIVQLYQFPDLPLGATPINVTKLNTGYNAGSTGVYINSAIGIINNFTYLQIYNGTNVDTDLRVSSSSNTTIYLASPLKYNQINQYPVQMYSYSALPSGSTPTGITRLSSQATAGSSTINVTSATGIVANTTYVQIDNGSLVETSLLVTAINGTTLTLSSPLTMNHVSDTSVQLFTAPALPVGTTRVNATTTNITSSVGSTSMEVSNVSGIVVGETYLMVGSGSTDQNILITGVSGNTIYLFSQIKTLQVSGSLVQFYTYSPLPLNAIPIGITTITSANSANATSIVVSSTAGIIANNTYLQIGSGSNVDTNVLVTGISNLTLTLSKALVYANVINTPVQLYTTLTYPLNILGPNLAQLSASYSENATTMTVSSTANIVANSTYVQLSSGVNVPNSLVTNINGNVLTLETPFTSAYSSNSIVQFYNYTPIPTGSTFSKTLLTQNASAGENTLTVSSTAGITPGLTYLQIGSGSSLETNILVTNVSDNVITVFSSLLYSHTTNEVVQLYSLSSLPLDTTLLGVSTVNSAISVGQTTINVSSSSISSIVANSTYLQLDYGSNLETRILIKSVNLTTNTLTLSTPFAYSHVVGTVVQYYSYPSLPLDSILVGTSSLTNASSVGATTLTFDSLIALYSGTLYAQIGSGSSISANILVSSFSTNSATLSSSLAYSYPVGTSIQFYTYPPFPNDSIYVAVTSVAVAYSSGTTVTLANASGITVGTYLQIGSGSSLKKDIYVSGVNGNVVTISASIPSSYIVGNLVQAYKYPDLPLDAIITTFTNLSIASSLNATSITVASTNGVVPGKSFISIGSGSALVLNMLVQSVSGSQLILSSPLTKSNVVNSLVQIYTYPDVPVDGTLIGVTSVASNYTTGTSLTVSSTSGVVAGKTFMLVGSSSQMIKNILVTGVSGSSVSFSSSLTNSYIVGRFVMFYTYPDVPENTSVLSITNLSNSVSANETTITLSSVSEIIKDVSYLQIGSGSSIEKNILVVDISGNVVTLGTPLVYAHPSDSVVQNYKYPDLPSDTVLVGLYYTTSAVTAGGSFLQLSSVSGLVAGNSYIQIGSGTNLETDLTVTSINTQLKTITVSPAFSYNRNANIYVQAYSTVPLPIGATKVSMARIENGVTTGNTTVVVTNIFGISAGMFITTGSGSIYERDLLISAVNTTTRTITLSSPFLFPHSADMPLQVYTYPALPSNATLSNVYPLSYATIGASSLIRVSTPHNITDGMYVQIGYGFGIERFLVVNVSNDTLLLSSQLSNNHSVGEPVQIYSYPSPTIPSGATSVASTRFTSQFEIGSSVINVINSSNINLGDNLILNVDTSLETKKVIDISGNNITLDTPTTKKHITYSPILQYSHPLPAIPARATFSPRILTSALVNAGVDTMVVSNASSITVGSFILIDELSSSETKLVIDVSGNTVKVDSNFTSSHPVYSIVQLYSYADPALPTYALVSSNIKRRAPVALNYCDTYISVVSTTGIVSGTYLLIGVDNQTEVCLVAGFDASLNRVYPELPLTKSHRKGTLIQSFQAVHPKGSILLNHLEIYQYVVRGATQNNGLLMNDVSCNNVITQITSLMDSLTLMVGNSVAESTKSLLTPIKNIIESKCLAGTIETTNKTISSYIPYYLTLMNYVVFSGKSAPNISSFSPYPLVYALWDILSEILNDAVPKIIDETYPGLDEVTKAISTFYNLYDNLYLMRLALDTYVKSCDVLNYNNSDYLTNNFPSIPTVIYLEGVMIGAGINTINEAGTVYPSALPSLKPTQVVTLQTASTNTVAPGENRLQVPSTSGILIGQYVTIDIGLAQETVKIIGYGSLIVEELKNAHEAGAPITIIEERTNINIVLDDFETTFRLDTDVETLRDLTVTPESTFTASGTAPISLFRDRFMFGTTDIENEILDESQTNINADTQITTYYVNSDNWMDISSNPLINISKLVCTNGVHNISTYSTLVEPHLGILLSAVLCYLAFEIKDSNVLIKNQKEYSDRIAADFTENIWNKKFYSLLWAHDFRRISTDSLTQTIFGNEITTLPRADLVEDPKNVGVKCVSDKPSALVNNSIPNKMMHQIAEYDPERINNSNLIPYVGLNGVYYLPLMVGDVIVFKLKIKYAIDNVFSLFSINPNNLTNVPQEIIELNNRLNLAINEHTDYISFNIQLTLV